MLDLIIRCIPGPGSSSQVISSQEKKHGTPSRPSSDLHLAKYSCKACEPIYHGTSLFCCHMLSCAVTALPGATSPSTTEPKDPDGKRGRAVELPPQPLQPLPQVQLPLAYIYIYSIHIPNLNDLYFGPPNTQNMAFSYQSRGQLGSR